MIDTIVWILLIAHVIFIWRMYYHMTDDEKANKFLMFLTVIWTGGLVCYFYYFFTKRPKDKEKKKFGTKA